MAKLKFFFLDLSLVPAGVSQKVRVPPGNGVRPCMVRLVASDTSTNITINTSLSGDRESGGGGSATEEDGRTEWKKREGGEVSLTEEEGRTEWNKREGRGRA